VVGFCFMTVMSGTNTLVQTICPDNLRSRVMSVYTMMFSGMAPFGALLAGYGADHFSAPMAVGAGGFLCLLVSYGFAHYLPVMRASAREEISARNTQQVDLMVR
jgi:MFS family permease